MGNSFDTTHKTRAGACVLSVRTVSIVMLLAILTLPGCGTPITRPWQTPVEDQTLDELSRLRARLRLSADQQPLWQDAESATRQMWRENVLTANNLKEQFRTELSRDDVALAPLAQRLLDAKEAELQRTRTTVAAWLVLDARLDEDQKEILREFLHTKVQRSEELDSRLRRQSTYQECVPDDTPRGYQ